jgi:hypothetical protein
MYVTKFNNTVRVNEHSYTPRGHLNSLPTGCEWKTELELIGDRSINSIPDLMLNLYIYYNSTPVTDEYEKEMLNLSVLLCNDYIAKSTSRGFTLEEIQESLQHTYPERFY